MFVRGPGNGAWGEGRARKEIEVARKRKDIPPLIAGAGHGAAIITALCEEAGSRALPPEGLHVLGTPDGRPYIKKIVELLAGDFGGNFGAFPTVANYDRSLEEKLEELIRLKRLCEVDEILSDKEGYEIYKDESAKRRGQEEIRIELVSLDRYLTPRGIYGVYRELDEADYRPLAPTELADLLLVNRNFEKLGRLHRKMESKVPWIAAMETIWRRKNSYSCQDYGDYVVCLEWITMSHCRLVFNPLRHHEWPSWHLLVVRKP